MLNIFQKFLGPLDNGYFFFRNRVFSKDPPLFYDGWGSNDAIEAVSSRFNSAGTAASIQIEWESELIDQRFYRYRDGKFLSPFYQGHLPREALFSYFRMILPRSEGTCPMVVHPATTREEGYKARERGAITLAKIGIGSVLLENPFRGRRRPSCQLTATLGKLSDFVLLCGAAIEETRSMLLWLRDHGHDRLVVAGISKGGYIASVAGILSEFPVAIATIVAPHNGVVVFIDGLTGGLCDWNKLKMTCGPGGDIGGRLRSVFNSMGLDRLPLPDSNKKIILVGALNDRFVPKESYLTMQSHWQNVEVRWLAGGHVSSILQRRYFVSAIRDALEGIVSDAQTTS